MWASDTFAKILQKHGATGTATSSAKSNGDSKTAEEQVESTEAVDDNEVI
jgi:hypothetical protein